VGVIRVYGLEPFGIYERSLLESVADTFGTKRLERERLLQVLGAGAMIQDSITKDDCVYRFLTTVTHGQALGINRAILFNYSQRWNAVSFELGIGPGSRRELTEMGKAIETVPSLEHCLEHCEYADINIRAGDLHRLMRGCSFSIDASFATPWAQTIRSATKLFAAIAIPRDEATSGELRELLSQLCVESFTLFLIPIQAGEGFILICDNPFWERDDLETSKRLLFFACNHFAKGIAALKRSEHLAEARLKTFQDIAANASHTMGNTLQPARAAVALLARRTVDARVRDELLSCKDLLDQAASSVRAFEQFYGGVLPREELTVGEFVELIASHVRQLPFVRRTCSTPVSQRLVVSSDQVRSCINILLANSRRHSRRGKAALAVELQIAPATTIDFRGSSRIPTGLRLDEYICLVYLDNGRGIEDAMKAAIFEPAFTTRKGIGGAGLAYLAAIVEAHRGVVCECGEPGENAKFCILLPLVPVRKEEEIA